ncbi:MAG: hypothetical protein WCK32_05425 [Chlorobiaceae bacterium]
MTDGQILLLILWLIYFTDCFVWLNKHSVLFSSWWGQEWKTTTASANFGTASGGFGMLNPFPPLGWHCVSQVLPLSFSPDHIVVYNSQTITVAGRPAQRGTVLAYADIGDVETKDSELWINRKLFCKLYCHELALCIRDLLFQLCQASRDDRIGLIDSFWEQRLDAKIAQQKLDSMHTHLSSLRILCMIMFFYLFLIIPFLTTLYGLARTLIPVAVIMFMMTLPIIVQYIVAHRSLNIGIRSDRLANAFKMFLSPPVAVRANDLVMNKVIYQYDLLSLASFLLSSSIREQFFMLYLRDLKYPIRIDSEDPAVEQACRYQNNIILEIARRQLPEVASIVKSAFTPPQKESNDRLSYCPRCFVQLPVKDNDCPDCIGIGLRSFEPV